MKYIIGRLLAVACGALCAAAADTPAVKPVTIDNPRTVVVGERSVPDIYVCQFQDTLLVLPKLELVKQSFVADTSNWILQAGKDPNEATRFISIKVKEPLTPLTTLNVISDHDSQYTFKLILNKEHCDSKVWIDPDSQLSQQIQKTEPWIPPAKAAELKAQLEQARAELMAAQQKAISDVGKTENAYLKKLRFDYAYDQKIAAKMGVRSIFHDDKYLVVAGAFQEAPTLFELKNGKPTMLQFHNDQGLYVAQIVKEGYLAVGGTGDGKHQDKLEFHQVANQ